VVMYKYFTPIFCGDQAMSRNKLRSMFASLKYRLNSLRIVRLPTVTFRRHRRSQGDKRAMTVPKFLENLASLCFVGRCPKENTVARLKSKDFPLVSGAWSSHGCKAKMSLISAKCRGLLVS